MEPRNERATGEGGAEKSAGVWEDDGDHTTRSRADASLHCPLCARAHLQVGSLAAFVPFHGGTSFYALCERCTARLHGSSKHRRLTLLERIERRLGRDPERYKIAVQTTEQKIARAKVCGGIPEDLELRKPAVRTTAVKDAAWFARNPRRLHHLRPVFAGEFLEFGESSSALAIGAHQAVVRQVEPGVRLRAFFDGGPLPDDEETAHAVFDIIVGRRA